MARENALASIKANPDRQASNLVPIVREIQKTGAFTLRDVADALNARGIPTARGGKWYATSVRNVLALSKPKYPVVPRLDPPTPTGCGVTVCHMCDGLYSAQLLIGCDRCGGATVV